MNRLQKLAEREKILLAYERGRLTQQQAQRLLEELEAPTPAPAYRPQPYRPFRAA